MTFRLLIFIRFPRKVSCQVRMINENFLKFLIIFTVFSCVVYFVYSNYCDVTEDLVMELLHTADMFLLPGLTKLAGNSLARMVNQAEIKTENSFIKI